VQKFLFQDISMQKNIQKKESREKSNYDLGVGSDEK